VCIENPFGFNSYSKGTASQGTETPGEVFDLSMGEILSEWFDVSEGAIDSMYSF
jgi:hypothetical protein